MNFQFGTLLKKRLLSTVLLGALSVPNISNAQTVEPMSFDLAPKGTGAETTLRVHNTTEESFPVEVLASKIEMTPDGNEEWIPADDIFMMFPPSAVVDAGSTQSIRVRYIGEPEISSSESYRISVKQVPVDLKGSGQTAIGFAVNFNTLANIVPSDSEPMLDVVSVEQRENGSYWNIILENKGNRYVRLSRTEWKLENGDGNSINIKGEEFSKANQNNIVLPKSTRHLILPAPDGFSPNMSSFEVGFLE